MFMSDSAYAARAARRRATWTARVGGEHRAVQVREITVEQRIAVMKELAEAARGMSGIPLPDYTRETMPCRILRADGT